MSNEWPVMAAFGRLASHDLSHTEYAPVTDCVLAEPGDVCEQTCGNRGDLQQASHEPGV